MRCILFVKCKTYPNTNMILNNNHPQNLPGIWTNNQYVAIPNIYLYLLKLANNTLNIFLQALKIITRSNHSYAYD
jgi:hypothetical protein